nr:mitogen-activated protein kinase kinase kinase 12-like [Chlorocebus sabaeus]
MTTRGHPNPRKRRPGRCREPRPLRPPPGDAVPGSAPVAPTPGRAGRAPFCLQGNSPRTVRTSRQVFRTGGRGGRGGRGGGRAGSRKVRKRNAAAAVPGCRPAASRSPVLEAPPWPPGAERRKDTFGLDLPGSAESDALWPPNGSLGTAGRRTAQHSDATPLRWDKAAPITASKLPLRVLVRGPGSPPPPHPMSCRCLKETPLASRSVGAGVRKWMPASPSP